MGQVAGAQIDRAVRGDGDPQQFFDVFSYLSNSFRGCPPPVCPGIIAQGLLFALWRRFWRVWGRGGIFGWR